MREKIKTAVTEHVTHTLRGVTLIGKKSIEYTIEVKKDGDWKTVWKTEVVFGRDKAHRPGGSAFKQAAEAQECKLLAIESGELDAA